MNKGPNRSTNQRSIRTTSRMRSIVQDSIGAGFSCHVIETCGPDWFNGSCDQAKGRDVGFCPRSVPHSGSELHRINI